MKNFQMCGVTDWAPGGTAWFSGSWRLSQIPLLSNRRPRGRRLKTMSFRYTESAATRPRADGDLQRRPHQGFWYGWPERG